MEENCEGDWDECHRVEFVSFMDVKISVWESWKTQSAHPDSEVQAADSSQHHDDDDEFGRSVISEYFFGTNFHILLWLLYNSDHNDSNLLAD